MQKGLERARELALRIIEDPEYLESLRKRAIAGTLDPVMCQNSDQKRGLSLLEDCSA